ncbi:ABC transporter ATP-binding protein [Thioalkalivibrio sp.]|uniref:ABC transporter ATP-binding protein n=1 Tax=Thioalkalivibrio sp. TaxID=2093813 RepID=UPI0012D55BE7|nr:ABC transporter ATP-binding protein [Thioalkalivibrio sp.]TVP78248.1 MAG: ABC transporter ATP-binding protein [Thioalkalivibrio sp.]
MAHPESHTSSEFGELRIGAVSKRYPGANRGEPPRLALESVSFDLQRGAMGVLLGPSGCGKSTLLRMVAGLESISEGRITVSGREVTGPGRDRGMVFQTYTSFPWLTVEENVGYGLRINSSAAGRRSGVVDYFLDRIGLMPFRKAYPEQLSGGMRQRVAIARALANQPDILLMDEPFGALDPETRWQMQELVLGIVHKERMTVLMVTHDIEEAIFMGDRIAFFSRGPGRLLEIIEPTFGADERRLDKAALKAIPDYGEMESHILQMMRAEGSRASEQTA